MECHFKNKKLNFFAGFLAVFSMCITIGMNLNDISIAFASLFLIFICITDSISSKIPNYCIILFSILAVCYNTYYFGFEGTIFSFFGFFLGLILVIIPFLMGGMGAGDVKALAALGALVGPRDIFQIFLYMGIIGGALALVNHTLSPTFRNDFKKVINSIRLTLVTRDLQYLRGERHRKILKFPYAAALAFGYFAFLTKGKLL